MIGKIEMKGRTIYRIVLTAVLFLYVMLAFILFPFYISKSEEICTITIENITREEEYPDTELVEKAINEITVPAIGCRIQIENCEIGNHASRINTMTAGRGQIDLINTGFTVSLSQLVTNGQVIRLDELLEQYGRGIKKKAGKLLEASTINGNIYSIPSSLYPESAMGIGYNKSIAQDCGLKLFEGMTIKDLTKLGQILKEKGIYLTSHGSGLLTAFPSYYDLEAFGGDLNYGVIFDPVNSTEIVNVYESSQYREYCEIVRFWREQGYIPSDSIFGGENGEKLFYEGKAFYQWSSVSPSTKGVIWAKQLDFKQELLAFTENKLSTDSILGSGWGISSLCENPEKAMEFLNLIYTNGDVANLLQYGLEGRQYEKIDNNTIRYLKNSDGEGIGYQTDFSSFGDECQRYYFEFSDGDFYQEVKQFSQEAKMSSTLGYLFDTEGLTAEIAAVSSVVSEYRPILETGMADNVSELLQRFNRDLEEAGIEQIIEENRRQLDQWKKTKEK